MISQYLNDTYCPLTGDRCYGECVLYERDLCKLEEALDVVRFDLSRIADALESIADGDGE